MHTAQWNAWLEAQSESRLRDKGRILVGKGRNWRRPYPYQKSHVASVMVQD